MRILEIIGFVGFICISAPLYVVAVLVAWVIMGDELEHWKNRRLEKRQQKEAF